MLSIDVLLLDVLIKPPKENIIGHPNWTAGTLKAVLVSLVKPVAYLFVISVKAWVKGLSNTNPPSAAGTAYELLATRKLMYEPAGTLKIHSTDQIAFGPKLQASYFPNDFKIKELLGSLSNIAPNRWVSLKNNPSAYDRRTVESDIAIGRPAGFAGTKEIFVDFKHTSGNARRLEPAELLGIAVAIATGEMHEAHFVCNAGLSGDSQQRIEDINQVLAQWGCSGTINGHAYFSV